MRGWSLALFLLVTVWSAQARAQLRVASFPSSVTASGHPMSAWFTLHNDTDQPVHVDIRHARCLDAPTALRVSGLEVDGTRVEGRFVVPARASVLLVVFVSGFEGPPRQRYDVAIDVCPTSAPCVEGRTLIGRAHRDPAR